MLPSHYFCPRCECYGVGKKCWQCGSKLLVPSMIPCVGQSVMPQDWQHACLNVMPLREWMADQDRDLDSR